MKKMFGVIALTGGLLLASPSFSTASAAENNHEELNQLLEQLDSSENMEVKFRDSDGNFSYSGTPDESDKQLIKSIEEYQMFGGPNEQDDFQAQSFVNVTGSDQNGSAVGSVRLGMDLQRLDWVDYSGYSGISWTGSGVPDFMQISTTLSHQGTNVTFNIPIGFSFSTSNTVATIDHAPEYNTTAHGQSYARSGLFVEGSSFGTSTRVTQSANMEARYNGIGYNIYPTVSAG